MTIRKFNLGTEWIFIKIYSGIKTSDIVLEEAIIPLVQYLDENNLIHKWFFIRYYDPKSHLRLRLHLKDTNQYGSVVKVINDKIKVLIDSGEISEINIDSYKREIERYGQRTIEFAEELFHQSSKLILNFLDYDDEEKIMVTMFYIDQILSKIKLPAERKLEWIEQYNNSFKKEFNSDKSLNSQLSKKFRDFRPNYHNFIHTNEFEEVKDHIILNIRQSHESLLNIVNIQKGIKLEDFFQSIFHMHINRIFTSNQRLFEMVIYDHLWRYYKVSKNEIIRL